MIDTKNIEIITEIKEEEELDDFWN